MNKKRLFEHLKNQEPSLLMDLLDSAYDEMSTNQRHDVFGKINQQIPPASVDGEKLLADIKLFYKNSLKGRYYEPFDINSKNFSDIPEETEKWFEELSDYLKDSAKLSEQGEHNLAVQCFKLLYQLINKMEEGEEIIFADEYGSWMIAGDEKKFIGAYLSSLKEISTPEEYTNHSIPLIKRDSYASFYNKVYSSAIKIANKAQKAHLKAEVKRQKIRTKPKY